MQGLQESSQSISVKAARSGSLPFTPVDDLVRLAALPSDSITHNPGGGGGPGIMSPVKPLVRGSVGGSNSLSIGRGAAVTGMPPVPSVSSGASIRPSISPAPTRSHRSSSGGFSTFDANFVLGTFGNNATAAGQVSSALQRVVMQFHHDWRHLSKLLQGAREDVVNRHGDKRASSTSITPQPNTTESRNTRTQSGDADGGFAPLSNFPSGATGVSFLQEALTSAGEMALRDDSFRVPRGATTEMFAVSLDDATPTAPTVATQQQQQQQQQHRNKSNTSSADDQRQIMRDGVQDTVRQYADEFIAISSNELIAIESIHQHHASQSPGRQQEGQNSQHPQQASGRKQSDVTGYSSESSTASPSQIPPMLTTPPHPPADTAIRRPQPGPEESDMRTSSWRKEAAIQRLLGVSLQLSSRLDRFFAESELVMTSILQQQQAQMQAQQTSSLKQDNNISNVIPPSSNENQNSIVASESSAQFPTPGDRRGTRAPSIGTALAVAAGAGTAFHEEGYQHSAQQQQQGAPLHMRRESMGAESNCSHQSAQSWSFQQMPIPSHLNGGRVVGVIGGNNTTSAMNNNSTVVPSGRLANGRVALSSQDSESYSESPPLPQHHHQHQQQQLLVLLPFPTYSKSHESPLRDGPPPPSSLSDASPFPLNLAAGESSFSSRLTNSRGLPMASAMFEGESNAKSVSTSNIIAHDVFQLPAEPQLQQQQQQQQPVKPSMLGFHASSFASHGNLGVHHSPFGSLVSQQRAFPILFTTKAMTSEDDVGMKMLNEYILMDTIGEGNCGKVKLAFSLERNISVAIKIVKRSAGGGGGKKGLGRISEAREAALRQEIAVMKKLRHKNIVSLYEVIDDPEAEKMYLVMQYVDKGSVGHVDAEGQCVKLEPHELAEIARQVATGLDYLHSRGVVHRDLKPENILVDSDGQAYLADFGVADVVLGQSATLRNETTAGTPLFLPPEAIRKSDTQRGAPQIPKPSSNTSPSKALLAEVPEFAASDEVPLMSIDDAFTRGQQRSDEELVSGEGMVSIMPQAARANAGGGHHPSMLTPDPSSATLSGSEHTAPSSTAATVANIVNGRRQSDSGCTRSSTISTISDLGATSAVSGVAALEQHSSDIWSLGVTLFTLLSGTIPFRSLEEIRNYASGKYAVPFTEKISSVEWRELLLEMMAVNPDHRPTAREVRTSLKRMIASFEKRREREANVVEILLSDAPQEVPMMKSPHAPNEGPPQRLRPKSGMNRAAALLNVSMADLDAAFTVKATSLGGGDGIASFAASLRGAVNPFAHAQQHQQTQGEASTTTASPCRNVEQEVELQHPVQQSNSEKDASFMHSLTSLVDGASPQGGAAATRCESAPRGASLPIDHSAIVQEKQLSNTTGNTESSQGQPQQQSVSTPLHIRDRDSCDDNSPTATNCRPETVGFAAPVSPRSLDDDVGKDDVTVLVSTSSSPRDEVRKPSECVLVLGAEASPSPPRHLLQNSGNPRSMR